MTASISISPACDFASSIAELELSVDQSQTESARQQRDAARQSYLADVQHQVDELHEAANATRTGALINASFQIAGSACELGAVSVQYRIDTHPCAANASWKAWGTGLGKLGEGFTKLSAPLQTLVGDSIAEDHQAEAKRYEALAATAQWQAGDSSAVIDKADKSLDKILDLAEEIQRDQNTATNAIIGRI